MQTRFMRAHMHSHPPYTHVHTPRGHKQILKVLVGETSVGCGWWEDQAAPVQLQRRVASWECRSKAARASEFLRETGKLNFYVKYPDF